VDREHLRFPTTNRREMSDLTSECCKKAVQEKFARFDEERDLPLRLP